jgi:MerR family redox-sensitive transcriptional activator SoxR
MVMDSFDWHEAGLTVGQVAERSGAAPSALRFYERQGLISADRTTGNQRRYHADVLCRVAMIRVCQQAGLSLAQISTALAEAIPDGQIPGSQEWEHLAQHLRQQLSSRIGDLDRLLGALAAPNADTQPSSAAPTASSEVHPRRNTDPPQPPPPPVGLTSPGHRPKRNRACSPTPGPITQREADAPITDPGAEYSPSEPA